MGYTNTFSIRMGTHTITQSARIVLHIEREMSLHLDYCASFGLSIEDIEKSPESIGMLEETAFLIEGLILTT